MTNDEFKKLCLLKKHFSDTNISLPSAGEKCSNPIPVYSDTTKDIFTLSLDRHGITLTKQKLQELHKNDNTVMIRLEIDCKPHMFRDGHFSSRNHIHIFDENEENGLQTYDLTGEYGKLFSDINDFSEVFYDFCKICNIATDGLNIQGVI